MFTLNQGTYQVQEGIFIKQKPLPNGNYSNVSVFNNGDYYSSPRDNFDCIRLFALEPCIINRVKEVENSRLIKQYQDIEELNYIQTFPIQHTKEKVYLFIEWAERKNIMHLLTQEMVAGFCGVQRPVIQRYFTKLREMGLINFSNETIK
jgi:hypothetical protein